MKNKEKDNAIIKKRTVLTARYVTQVAVMAGLITALKFALSFLPNIEVITVLIAVFSTVWGMKYSVPAVLVFCTVEMAIYGIGSWVPLYYIYWPMLAVVFHFALRKKKTPVAMGIAVPIGLVFSVLFGVLSASTETLFVIGAVNPDMLGTFFVSYYLKGLWFDIVHTISVVVSILVLYIPLVEMCQKITANINPTPRENVDSDDIVESDIDDTENVVEKSDFVEGDTQSTDLDDEIFTTKQVEK
jgi:hypothetical protein